MISTVFSTCLASADNFQDWIGTHSGVASVLAGLDMTMPGDSYAYNSADSYFGANLTVAVLNGTVPAVCKERTTFEVRPLIISAVAN